MSRISILIPARDEQENIRITIHEIVKEFDLHGLDFEILVVDDGSQDQTPIVVEELMRTDARIRLIKNTEPYGFGNAIRKGLDCFSGDYVMIVMADSSDDPKDMLRYIEEVQKGYDCCFGSRWMKGALVKDYPRHKLALNRLVNWGINAFFRLGYNDVTNAFKCYSRRTIQGIKPVLSRHFNITVELPLKACVRGYTYAVVPTNWYNRKKGISRLKIQEMGSRYLFIIIYVFLEKLLTGSDYKKRVES